jgi:putative ABC transport system permease protein
MPSCREIVRDAPKLLKKTDMQPKIGCARLKDVNQKAMLRNYLKTALRIMMRQKAYTFINVTGLSVGIAATLLITIYVVDEFSFDRFHKRAANIYRVGFTGRLQGNEISSAVSSAPIAETMQKEIPEVEEALRFALWRTMPMSYGDKNFTEKYFLVSDSNFFQFFDFPLIAGNPATALKGTNKIVITESAAKKYFGQENPIGKLLLRGAEKIASEVTGVAQDPPHNSHIAFDMILSAESADQMKNTQWTSNNIYTYVKLHAAADVQKVEDQLKIIAEKNMGSEIERFLGMTMKQFREQGNNVGLFLQPFLDIHLKSSLSEEVTPNGNIQYLYVFIAIAFFIILIACINFMNLSTARSANRAKEVGVRKTIGAFRQRLIIQFISESMLYSFFSMLLAIVTIALSLNGFNLLSGKDLSLTVLMNPVIIAAIIIFTITVGLLAGSYPAFYLTAFKPTEVLKGKIRAGFKNSALRNSLVVCQFIISIALIFGSIVVYRQLKFMQEKNLGFSKENVVSLLHTISLDKNAQAFKNELASHPEFKGASFANRLPPNIDWNSAFRKGGSDQDFLLAIYNVDHDHLATMGFKMVEGRFFSKDFPTDTAAIILNETAYKQMGFTNMEEATVLSYQGPQPTPLQVIGVMKDFHYESLRSEVKPMAVLLGREPNFEMAIRLSSGDTQQQIELLETIWKKYSPASPFEYSFLDQNFDALFRAEQRLGKIILIFTVLAIGIACLGLFGLAAYTAEQRAKEISIRKVMGASNSHVMILLSKDFALLIMISFIIAAPMAWYFSNGWLEGFANRIDLKLWMVFASGAISLTIALIIITLHSVRAARENPVKAMRSE